MKKITISALAFTLFSYFNLQAQNQSSFQFEETSYDFGTLYEGDDATHEFKFKNIGKDTIKLTRSDVKASCGCTTPKVSEEPILANGTGIVSAQYGTQGRVGPFTKTVTVFYKGNTEKVLMIKGIVERKDTTKYTDAQLKNAAKLYMEKTAHNFGKVERGQRVAVKLVVKNMGKDTLKILRSQAACGSCLTQKLYIEKKDKTLSPVTGIAPGKSGILEVTYMPSGDATNQDVLTLFTNDYNAPKTVLRMTALVVESLIDKSPMIEDKSGAPFGK